MSLHVLANHMATKGRGSDSMLVHMTPEEVASLQALAMKNGGSLTINPDTGLPEAGFLKKLLPMIAGFALGPAGFGLMSAAGAGLAVGGVTALATGSLSKGLMAGLGAYGGAGLGQAFMGAGANAVGAQSANLATSLTDAQAQALGFQNAATAPAANAAATSNLDKIGAGFKAVTDTPSAFGQFAKDNWKAGLAAASPFIADAMVPTTTKMPTSQYKGYIRPYQYDANTRTVKAMDPVLASEWGARQFPDFIRKGETAPPAPSAPPAGLGQQLPPGMASGGIVALAGGGILRSLLKQVEQRADPALYAQAQQAQSQAQAQAQAPAQNTNDPYARFNTLSGQSKDAYDYLMGNTASSAVAPVATVQPPAPTPTPTPTTGTTTSTTPTTGVTEPTSAPTTPPPRVYTPPTYIDPDPIEPPPFEPDPTDPDPIRYPEPEPDPEPMPPDPYPYPEPEPEPEPVLPWEPPPYEPEPVEPPPFEPDPDVPDPIRYPEPSDPYNPDPVYNPPYIPDPEPVDPNFFEPGYGNTGVPEPVPYQGDPYDQPYTPPQGDPYDQPYDNTEYEVQPWENVDNSGYYDGSMAGDNSLNSGNNTYTGETDSVQQQGLPDAFGSYPGEPTYIGNDDGGAGTIGGGSDRFIEAESDDNIDEDRYDYAGNANGGLMGYANGGMMPRYALGGLGALGGYSDGGRLLKGPGDGVSDSIPATIGRKKHPARLADGEFVVPARIVSELGNGSTEAGARKLYAMMDRIQKARGKTVGKGKVAANSRSEKHLPA